MVDIQALIPQLSAYQYGLLSHTASAPVPIFLLPRPTRTDNAGRRYGLNARSNEIKSLVAMGLLEDASEEFKESVAEHSAAQGRKFKVYGLTEIGYYLFRESEDRAID